MIISRIIYFDCSQPVYYLLAPSLPHYPSSDITTPCPVSHHSRIDNPCNDRYDTSLVSHHLLSTHSSTDVTKPIVVRMRGTYAAEAKKLLDVRTALAHTHIELTPASRFLTRTSFNIHDSIRALRRGICMKNSTRVYEIWHCQSLTFFSLTLTIHSSHRLMTTDRRC